MNSTQIPVRVGDYLSFLEDQILKKNKSFHHKTVMIRDQNFNKITPKIVILLQILIFLL